jgi:hypothetical protein
MATTKPQIHTESGPLSENGHGDKPALRHADDISAEERQALLADHRGKKESVMEVAQEMLAKTYENTRGFRSIDKTVDVVCPLPDYAHLTFVYKVNTPSWKRAEMRPSIVHNEEMLDLEAKVAAKQGVDVEMDGDEVITPAIPPTWDSEQEAIATYDRLSELRRQSVHDYIRQWCEYAALFVVGVRGWKEARPVGENADGELIMEPIPAPSRFRPESFQVIYDEMRDLGDWLIDDGYITALHLSLPSPNS